MEGPDPVEIFDEQCQWKDIARGREEPAPGPSAIAMTKIIPIVLWAWVPFTIWLFRRGPARRAALVGLLGGWLLLPSARFPDEVAFEEFPYWIMPSCLPSSAWTTKARIVGLACLLGVVLFDRKRLGTIRPAWCDLAVIAWCAWPIASAMANRLYASEAIANAAYQSLAWGVPYLLGRLYFASGEGMDELARAVVACGLLSIPLAVSEMIVGPFCYGGLYGFHPYQHDGITRYVGFRPMLFLEHGNQFGIWIASAALVAAWLWVSGRLARILGLPGGPAVAALVGMTLASQSMGGIILLVGGLSGMMLVRRCNLIWPILAVMVLVLGFLGVRASNVVDAKALAERVGLGSVRLKRQSFGWRLRVEEGGTRIALQRPVAGWGRWDWWRRGEGEMRPWGLFTLTLGMYGVVGLVLLIGVFTAPIVHFLRLGPPRLWASPPWASAAAMAAALGVNALDAILNSTFLLAAMAAAGGLAAFRPRAVPPTAAGDAPTVVFWAQAGPPRVGGAIPIPPRRGPR
jgi:hypothetical protein